MAYAAFDAATMAPVEVAASGTAKKRWRLEDGPPPVNGVVVVISAERGSDANGKPI